MTDRLTRASTRWGAVDVVRGLVMVVMAIDHVRDFMTEARFDPTDLNQTSPGLFLTRWITHFCAPAFCFLSGTSAYLSGANGKSKRELSRFLLTRGLWLVLLELTVIRFGWEFNFNLHTNTVLVIWALGWSMIVLAGLVWLPLPAIITFGALLVLGHNALDGFHADGAAWWMLLHEGFQVFELAPSYTVLVVYPLVPWLGVMALGYGFGAVGMLPEAQRQRWLWRGGMAVCVLFIALRWSNFYGDARPWLSQPSLLFTLFSFLNTTKYPPSLLYLAMTLGPTLLALAFVGASPPKSPAQRVLSVYGRVPMFYYIAHLYLIHTIAGVAAVAEYGTNAFAFGMTNLPDGFGYSLPVIYGVWLGAMTALYPLCRWYDGVKQRRRDLWWLSYL